MESTGLEWGITPRLVVGGEDGDIHADQQVVIGLAKQRVMSVEIVRYKHGTHFAFARRGTIQIRDHYKRNHLAVGTIAMVDLLRQFIER